MSQSYRQRKRCWSVPLIWGTAFGVLTAVVIAAAAAEIGFRYGQASILPGSLSARFVTAIEAIFKEDRKLLEAADQKFQAQMDVFAGRVGEIQAELLRLNALGGRLVEMAGLSAEEFDFENPVSIGGPAGAGVRETRSELARKIIDLPELIHDRLRKLEQLEQAIMEKGLKKQAMPFGWPVRSGYISSGFGYRIHPIFKKNYFHEGVDFASKRGTPIFASADGVVIYSGQQSGYGRIVKIRHMDGMVTCYAHNQANLVKPGDLVKKGQIIAKLGSSGRSTGPHVHFEVRENDKAIDPMSYIGFAPHKRQKGS